MPMLMAMAVQLSGVSCGHQPDQRERVPANHGAKFCFGRNERHVDLDERAHAVLPHPGDIESGRAELERERFGFDFAGRLVDHAQFHRHELADAVLSRSRHEAACTVMFASVERSASHGLVAWGNGRASLAVKSAVVEP